eukprot:SAG31_NODE_7978_length_1550_cov_1.203997_1_plen_313_part_00
MDSALTSAHAAFLETLPASERDKLTDELVAAEEQDGESQMMAELSRQLASLVHPHRAVRFVGLQARPDLNDCDGVVVGQQTNGRHQVRTGGKDVRVKPINLRPAPTDRAVCLEVGVTARGTPRNSIDIRAAPEMLPIIAAGNVEEAEKRILRQSRGWARPQGLKGYSTEAIYPDLYVYFDAESTAPLNEMVHAAFSAYPNDGMPAGGIRGNAVVMREGPPTAIDQLGNLTEHEAVWNELITFDEMRDTLKMYDEIGADAAEIARTRDMNRLFSGLPPEVLAQMSQEGGANHAYFGPSGPHGYGQTHQYDFGH